MTLENEAIQRICKDLSLPTGDPFTQDWVYELPEQYRTEPHLRRFLSAYESVSYGNAERRVLVSLILDVINDLLSSDREAAVRAWRDVVLLVKRSPLLHEDQLERWVAPDSSLDDAYALTPFARTLWSEVRG